MLCALVHKQNKRSGMTPAARTREVEDAIRARGRESTTWSDWRQDAKTGSLHEKTNWNIGYLNILKLNKTLSIHQSLCFLHGQPRQ